MRLQDINGRRIVIGGHEIKEFTIESLRHNKAYIPQETYLFNRSVRDNIKYGKSEATDEEMYDACKKACCYNFITQMDDGFNTIISEGGTNLSGGQKNRLIIARAILKNSPILILDESTSALDVIMEKEVTDILQEYMKNRTTIAIAHRLQTLLHMDRILVFSEGQIVEDGKVDDLLKIQNGLFKEMWDTLYKQEKTYLN